MKVKMMGKYLEYFFSPYYLTSVFFVVQLMKFIRNAMRQVVYLGPVPTKEESRREEICFE